MHRPASLTLCALLLAAAAATVAANPALAVRGAAFSTGHDPTAYRYGYVPASLRQLRRTGSNYVQISVYARMRSLNAANATQQTDDASIRYIVRAAHRAGFRVFLKPVIEIAGDTWRGFLPGTAAWFQNVYRPFIAHMATIAAQERVDIFSVGSEYRNSEVHVRQWSSVIDLVRSVYRGPITYIANHDSYQRFRLWHRLDMISISAYFQLLPGERGPSPDMAATSALWRRKAAEIRAWRLARGLAAKKLLIAEVGVQSKGDGVVYRVPWNWSVRAPVNFHEQEKMYAGICDAFSDPAWVAGILFWNWELQPYAGTSYPTSADYTPQNKPAEQVMRRCFARA